jgi:hypothetical protein
MFVLLHHLCIVFLGMVQKGSILVSFKCAALVVIQWSDALELVLVNTFELFDNAIGVMDCNGNVVGIDGDVFVDALTGMHPNVGVGFARCKTHVTKCVSKPLMPTESTTTYAIQGLVDDEYVTGKVPNLWSGNNKDFLLDFGFKVSIIEVGSQLG